jgi:hypothetical protein
MNNLTNAEQQCIVLSSQCKTLQHAYDGLLKERDFEVSKLKAQISFLENKIKDFQQIENLLSESLTDYGASENRFASFGSDDFSNDDAYIEQLNTARGFAD